MVPCSNRVSQARSQRQREHTTCATQVGCETYLTSLTCGDGEGVGSAICDTLGHLERHACADDLENVDSGRHASAPFLGSRSGNFCRTAPCPSIHCGCANGLCVVGWSSILLFSCFGSINASIVFSWLEIRGTFRKRHYHVSLLDGWNYRAILVFEHSRGDS